jgi:hypothetical protein
MGESIHEYSGREDTGSSAYLIKRKPFLEANMPTSSAVETNLVKLEQNGLKRDEDFDIVATVQQFANIDNFGTEHERPIAKVGKYDFYGDEDSNIQGNVGGVFIHKARVNFDPDISSFEDTFDFEDDGTPGLVINFREKQIIIRNGDTDSNGLVRHAIRDDFPTTSFNCLEELFGPAVNLLLNGKLRLIDYTPDSKIPMTATEKRTWQNFRRRQDKNPPGTPTNRTGYSAVSLEWHRSGSCLFEFNGKRFLTGQDEGTYFGVQLAGQPNTVDEAFLDLVPSQIQGKSYRRQGEWFVVPALELGFKNIPHYWEPGVLACGSDYDAGIVLPREEDGNEHTIHADEVVVTKDGVFARGGYLGHDEHREVHFSGDDWVTFLKSTAVRSVSIEGVD